MSEVRRFVVAAAVRLQQPSDDAALVASELATNAVLHARSHFAVAVGVDDHHLRIEVSDDNPRVPVTARSEPEALSGRGLQLVAAVAHAWGVERTMFGKVVWATV